MRVAVAAANDLEVIQLDLVQHSFIIKISQNKMWL